jgi:hypothetical protein
VAKKTFFITVRALVNGKVRFQKEEIEGTALKNEYGLDLFVHKDRGNYVVSEVTTGSRITKSHKTKRDAVSELNEIVNRIGVDEAKKNIEGIAERIKTEIA